MRVVFSARVLGEHFNENELQNIKFPTSFEHFFSRYYSENIITSNKLKYELTPLFIETSWIILNVAVLNSTFIGIIAMNST